MEDGPHTGAIKRSITDRARDDFMSFAATGTDVRLGRRIAVFAVGRVGQLQTSASACFFCLYTWGPPSEKVVDSIDLHPLVL